MCILKALQMTTKLYFSSPIMEKAFDTVLEEQNTIGYYALPDQNIDEILSFAAQNTKRHIVVIGIGGSSLGAKAIYHFVRPSGSFKGNQTLHFLESTDPITLHARLSEIDLNDALFLVISKSGTTIETISIFKYIASLVPVSPASYAVITDAGSPLETFAKEHRLNIFHIPHNVGGRFSVLSNAGLVPLALCGIDIQGLLSGAKSIKDDFFAKNETYQILMTKASHYAANYTRNNINAVFSYSEIFRHFNEWYVQLWGESLGKHQRHSSLSIGLTPSGLIGPTDQHSFLQLIVEGPRDKTVTFIKIKNFEDNTLIPSLSLTHLQGLDILNGHRFSDLINMQADSIIAQLEALDIPLDVITLERADEENIGGLMYSYELLTSLVAAMLDIDAYDQPGVEGGKTILKKMLAECLQ